MKIYVMVEFDLNSDYLEDLGFDLADLKQCPDLIKGEIVKIKSGEYENLLTGTIIGIRTEKELEEIVK